jgi:regulator of sigma E protease
MPLLKFIYIVAAVVFLFGAAVFVHEFGHFWVALKRGLKVEAFAIGFGPKIFGWKRNGIDYAWRWIPAGGYVKLPQMLTSEALEGESTSTEKLPPVSPLSKILVSLAGPLMNVVFAFVVATIIYFVGLPVTVNPSIIGYVEPGWPEAKMGIVEGDVITKVNGKPVNSWEGVQMTTVLARTNVIPVEIQHRGEKKTYQLPTITSEALGLKVLNLEPRDHPVIMEALSGGAAEAAGLKAGDEIVSVAKVPALGTQHFIKMIQSRPGEPTEIVVKRGQEKLALTVTPRCDSVTKKGVIGAQLSDSAAIVYRVQRPGPTPWTQVSEVVEKTVDTFSALIHSRETGVKAKDFSGPVGILGMLASQVAIDYRLALSFLVLLNVNLAMINLLPLPVLDGGHIAMSILEWIRRRPLNVKFVEYATTVFAVLLISFMLYVTFFDIKRMPLLNSLFKRKVQIEQQDKAADGASAPSAPAPAPAPSHP